MNKKTKLLVGAGIVGVGAYLLWKSKKAAAPVVAPAASANLVGADGTADKFAGVGARQISADGGRFAGVGKVEKFGQDGSQFFDVKGGHAGIPDAGIFKKAIGEKKALVSEEKVSPRTKFANGTFGDTSKKLVGVNGANTFFAPHTAKFADDRGVFARKQAPSDKIKALPVEPMKPVTQSKPLNNMVGASGMINGSTVPANNWF